MTAITTTNHAGLKTAYRFAAILEPLEPGESLAYAQLVPKDMCPKIEAEILAALRPCGPDRGKAHAQFLIGCYPAREVNDANVYTLVMSRSFSEVPDDIARVATDRISRKLKFLPTRADVEAEISAQVGRRRAMLAAVKAHAREHERRERERERNAEIAESRNRLKATLGDAWDAWFSIPILRRYTGTPEEFAANWLKASDKAAFVAAWGSDETQTAED